MPSPSSSPLSPLQDGSVLASQEMAFASLHQGYRSRAFRILDIVRECMRRIEACKQPVFLHLADEAELFQIAERQQALLDAASGNTPELFKKFPLLGLPFAVKDNIDVAGMPTTAACPTLRRLPTESSPAVEALLRAGAICLGKTNMDQLATGLVGVRSPYGMCRNAFLPNYISGGSSSGSGLAVALGLCCFALGTDTAGSGRVPAALGNIIGLKPSRGAVSTRGVVPACPSLDCVSLFTLFADDAAHIYPHMGGYDELDPWSRRRPSHASMVSIRTSKTNWQGLRLAVAHPEQLDFAGDTEYAQLYAKSLKRAQGLGALTLEQDIGPLFEAARLLYQGPWIAERYAAIAESIDPDSGQVLPVIREVLRPGRNMPATEAFRGQRRLQVLKRACEHIFANSDVLLLPTLPTAFTVEAVQSDPIALNAVLGRFTNFVNLLDLCAIAVPAGFREDGLPFGITLIAPAFHDEKLLDLVSVWERNTQLGSGIARWPIPVTSVIPHSSTPSSSTPPALIPSAPENKMAANVLLLVFGLHMRGQPLAKDVENLGGEFVESVTTAPGYAMYALSRGDRHFPGVLRDPAAEGGLAGDLWLMPKASLGAFMATLASPLCLGFVELDDGRKVVGFLAEAIACQGMPEITAFGGWLAYRKSLSNTIS